MEKASTEKQLATERAIDIPIMDIAELEKLTLFVAKVKETLMTEGRDYIIQGKKQYTSRSGFAKLAQGFNLSDEILVEKEITRNGEFYGFDYTIRVFNAYGRQATGVGSCSIDEPNLVHHKERPYHDVRSIAFTRAWNRAVSNFVGSADVSAEEMSLGEDFKDRKDIESEQRDVYPLPKTPLDTPSWDFTEAVKGQGWEAIDEITATYLRDTGFETPESAFEWGHDVAKAWVRNAPGIYWGDGMSEVDTVLKIAGFKYDNRMKGWRFNKPEGVE